MYFNLSKSLYFILVSIYTYLGAASILNDDGVYFKLLNLSKTYPHLTKLYSIGNSTAGRALWVLTINSNRGRRIPLQPHVRLVANIHGNEVSGRYVLGELCEYLLETYKNPDHVSRDIIDSTTLHVMPSFNPDGFSVSTMGECKGVMGRYNLNRVDLNRNFPQDGADPQIETKAMINWMEQETHTLAATLHGGAVVAVYPWDIMRSGAKSPDDDVFRYLALNYSKSHPTMPVENIYCVNTTSRSYFKDGIVQGYVWYEVKGSIQDYTYLRGSGYELTIEVSCCKYPNVSQYHQIWLDHKNSLISFIKNVHMGVKGIVSSNDTKPISSASVTIKGREYVVFKTNKYGEYWKLLLPGTYTLQVWSTGYSRVELEVTVYEGEVTRQDVTLARSSSDSIFCFLGETRLFLVINIYVFHYGATLIFKYN